MLSYLLFNPTLIPLIRQEILPVMSAGHFDEDYLFNSCPHLNALWDETLRCTSFAASVRFLTEDIVLPSSSMILRKGNRVMMPQRQLHYNEKIFGTNAAHFDIDRFIIDPKMRKSKCYRPFRGGSSLCPGRHFAKRTTLAFIVALLQKFDIELSGEGQKFPTPTEGNPSIGLIDVTAGTDLQVLLKVRSWIEQMVSRTGLWCNPIAQNASSGYIIVRSWELSWKALCRLIQLIGLDMEIYSQIWELYSSWSNNCATNVPTRI